MSDQIPPLPHSTIHPAAVAPEGDLTAAQEAEARSVMDMASKNIAVLDGQIAKLSADLEAHRTARAQQVAVYRTHASVFSSFRRIPSEILSEIFLWTAQSDTPTFAQDVIQTGYSLQSSFRAFQHSSMRTPVVLSQVCRRWRKDSIREPRLWNTIILYLQDGIPLPQIALVAAYVLRSQHLPLSIQLVMLNDDITYQGDSADMDRIYATLRLLTAHSDRWQQAEISLPLDALPRDIFGGQSFPILKRLRLFSPVRSIDRPPFKFSTNAPMLRHVTLDGPSAALISATGLPWDNIVTLIASTPSTLFMQTKARELLERASNAEELSVKPTAGLIGQPSGIIHQRLIRLTVNSWSTHFFANISLPSLEEFTLQECHKLVNPAAFSTFFDQCPDLKVMRYSDCSLYALRSTFSHCRARTLFFQFTLDNITLDKDLQVISDVGSLEGVEESTTPYFPSLTSFRCAYSATSNFYDNIDDGMDMTMMLRTRDALLRVTKRLGGNVEFRLDPASCFPSSMTLPFEQLKEMPLDGLSLYLQN